MGIFNNEPEALKRGTYVNNRFYEDEYYSLDDKNRYICIYANSAVRDNKNALGIFSLAKSAKRFMLHLKATNIGLSVRDLTNVKLSEEQLELLADPTNPLNSAPIYIDDSRSLKIAELIAKIREMKKQYDIKYLIIDGVYFIDEFVHCGGNKIELERTEERIEKKIKELTKELSIPIVTTFSR